MMEPIDIYKDIQFLVQKEIDDKISTYADKSKMSVAQVPAHQHTGVDSTKVEFSDLGSIPTVTTIPTYVGKQGEMVLCRYEPVVTISNASPALIYLDLNKFAGMEAVTFTTDDALPSPLIPNQVYYIKNILANANQVWISSSPGGTAINTTDAGSGIHTMHLIGLYIFINGAWYFAPLLSDLKL